MQIILPKSPALYLVSIAKDIENKGNESKFWLPTKIMLAKRLENYSVSLEEYETFLSKTLIDQAKNDLAINFNTKFSFDDFTAPCNLDLIF